MARIYTNIDPENPSRKTGLPAGGGKEQEHRIRICRGRACSTRKPPEEPTAVCPQITPIAQIPIRATRIATKSTKDTEIPIPDKGTKQETRIPRLGGEDRR